jgi:quinol monooxygenase YgiN
MATLFAHIQIKAGQEPAFEALCQTLHERSHAEDSGLIRYEYWRSGTPGLYYCLLVFEDYRSFMAHQTSAHHEDAVPALHQAIESMRLEWLDPVPGASDLPATREQSLSDDASPLAKRYAETIPVQIAAWWAR